MTYICRSCPERGYSNVEEALDHVNSHSSFSDKACVVPGCRYSKIIGKTLSGHMSKKHSSLCQYPCPDCRKRFVRHDNMEQHRRDKPHGTSNLVSQHHLSTPGYNMFFSPIIGNNNVSNPPQFSFDIEMTDSDLNSFIDGELQPDVLFNAEMGAAVNGICKFFHEKMQPKEIIKGGSMGKGTAIKGDADIDMVLIVDDVSSAAELRRELPNIKRRIKQYLSSRHEDAQFSIVPRSISETTFAVKFTIRVDGKDIDIDLLPTFHFTDKTALYKEMGRMQTTDRPLLSYYSAALVKRQVDFVQKMPPNVKNLIRLIKYWNKNYARVSTSSSIQPTSYAMELITISVWRDARKPNTFNMLQGFRSVMERLRNPELLNVVWNENYSEHMIPSDIRQQRPRLMDPANPTNNLYKTFTWDHVEEAAENACNSTLLRGVPSL